MRKTITAAALTAIMLTVVPAMAEFNAELSAEQRCEAGKNDAAGKYAACIAKAERSLVLSGNSENYGAALFKCESKLVATWSKLEVAAVTAGTRCLSTGDRSLIEVFVDGCVQSVATALAGGPLGADPVTCNAQLGTCPGDLATCTSSLGTCPGNLATCTSSLGTCPGNLATCNGTLGTCNAGTAGLGNVLTGKTFSSTAGLGVTGTMANVGQQNVTPGISAVTITQGYHNGTGSVAGDADLVAGNIASGVNIFGVVGSMVAGSGGGAQLLKTGQTTSYGAGTDGDVQKGAARSFTDNGNGTVTDNASGLMWEKKDASGGIHDRNNLYTWSTGSGSMDGTVVSVFLASLNSGGGFAGHTDWRVPNIVELQSLVNYDVSYPGPATFSAFNDKCLGACTVTTCSCTRADYCWSSSTYQSDTSYTWFVGFLDGYTGDFNKTNSVAVRAVRGGA